MFKVKRAFKAHRSNVGYRGLLHCILGKKLIIPRNALGSRQNRLSPINHIIGRPRKEVIK